MSTSEDQGLVVGSAYPSQCLPQPQLEACEDAQVHGRRLRSLQSMHKAITNAACSALC